MIDLNDCNEIISKDPDGYLKLLKETPEMCRQNNKEFNKNDWEKVSFDKILVSAMGGSAIGADLAKYLIENQTNLPIQIVRDYVMPNWLDENTLFLAISYSGNTEETISGYLEARKKKAKIFVITSGGKLSDLARSDKYPIWHLPKNLPPRTAWGLSFFTILSYLTKQNAAHFDDQQMEDMFLMMEKMIIENEEGIEVKENLAKQIAIGLQKTIPIVLGAQHLGAVARRWKGEFNENSKIPSYYEEFPELNHNSQQGLECSEELKKSLNFLILNSDSYHERNILRAKVIYETLVKTGFSATEIKIGGKSEADSIVGAVVLGDYISVYLAFLLDKNPVLFTAIEDLKSFLKTEEYVNRILNI